jgi:hypothetical protein
VAWIGGFAVVEGVAGPSAALRFAQDDGGVSKLGLDLDGISFGGRPFYARALCVPPRLLQVFRGSAPVFRKHVGDRF